MLQEIDAQLAPLKPDIVITPVGVGSLAQAVVSHYKQQGRKTAVVTVEPQSAACLRASLVAGRLTTIETSTTIMAGMECGSVSTIAWPVLRDGVDVAVSVSDLQAHLAVEELEANGVEAGPCGAASLAALRRLSSVGNADLVLDENAVVVLLCTEGRKEYTVPRIER